LLVDKAVIENSDWDVLYFYSCLKIKIFKKGQLGCGIYMDEGEMPLNELG